MIEFTNAELERLMKSYTTGSKYCDNPRDGKTWAEFFQSNINVK